MYLCSYSNLYDSLHVLGIHVCMCMYFASYHALTRLSAFGKTSVYQLLLQLPMLILLEAFFCIISSFEDDFDDRYHVPTASRYILKLIPR